MDIPMDPSQPEDTLHYLVMYDDGRTRSVPLADMSDIVLKPPAPATELDIERGLPPHYQVGQKVTYEHEGQYYKGYMGRRNGVYRFEFRRHPNSKSVEWGVDLPDLVSSWVSLSLDGVLQPGHTASSFLRGTSDPVANIVSAVNLHSKDAPMSLVQALADANPDREIWLQSFYEEKDSIESMNTYQKRTLGEYRALREKGAPRAIPTMCVLTVKKDESLMPVRAKSRIVVLGNQEDRDWSKSDRYAPVLRTSSLCFLVSMAVEAKRMLKQGDCKNAFCQGVLPDDEVTIVRPPKGDPSAAKGEFWLLKRCLYGLRRSPRHWYNKIDGFLRSMGLRRHPYDPCVYWVT